MPPNTRGPYLAGGFPGQVLVKGVDGSNRTFWTDAANLNILFGGGADTENLEPISETRTYYVNGATGSDTLNNGRTPDHPFATLQRAADAIATIYVGEFRGLISVADGTYIGAVVLPNALYAPRPLAQADIPPFAITGNIVNRDAVVIDNTGVGAQSSGHCAVEVKGHWGVDGLKLKMHDNSPAILVHPTGIARVGPLNVQGVPSIVGTECYFLRVDGGQFYALSAGAFTPTNLVAPLWTSVIEVLNRGHAEFPNGSKINITNTNIVNYGANAFVSVRDISTATFHGMLIDATACTGRQFYVANLSELLVFLPPLPGTLAGVCVSGGTYNGYVPSTPVSAAQTLQSSLSGAMFTNEGAGAIVPFTLPPNDFPGIKFAFYVQNAFGIRVIAGAGDTIRFGATVTAAAGSISATAIGNLIEIESINPTEWVATRVVGTWVTP